MVLIICNRDHDSITTFAYTSLNLFTNTYTFDIRIFAIQIEVYSCTSLDHFSIPSIRPHTVRIKWFSWILCHFWGNRVVLSSVKNDTFFQLRFKSQQLFPNFFLSILIPLFYLYTEYQHDTDHSLLIRILFRPGFFHLFLFISRSKIENLSFECSLEWAFHLENYVLSHYWFNGRWKKWIILIILAEDHSPCWQSPCKTIGC